MKNPIYLSPPHLTGKEYKFIEKAINSNWVSVVGDELNIFNEKLSHTIKFSRIGLYNSGTSALHLALRVLGIGYNDIVLTSTFTFVASVNPIAYVGAIPVLIESEDETWNISPTYLEKAIKFYISKGKRPKAILLVHLYGMPANMGTIKKIAKIYDIPIIEDAAESLGSTYKNKQLGTLGTLGVISFNGNKIITTGAGGALLSRQKNRIDKANFLASQAKESELFYQHKEIGYNYQMTTLQAAMGLAQIEKLKDYIQLRRRNYDYYKQNLTSLGFEFLDEPNTDYFSNRWLTTCLLSNKKLTPNQVINALKADKIEARRLWKPMHLQPLFKDIRYFGDNLSSKLFKEGICLPSGSSLSLGDLNRIIKIIKSLGED